MIQKLLAAEPSPWLIVDVSADDREAPYCSYITVRLRGTVFGIEVEDSEIWGIEVVGEIGLVRG